jgi:hypothetical protein
MQQERAAKDEGFRWRDRAIFDARKVPKPEVRIGFFSLHDK